MADEPVVVPPVATPAPAAVPPVQAAIPGTGVSPQPQAPKNKGPRGKEIRIPEHAFKNRVVIEAARIIKARLGVTIEEAEKIVKAGGVTTPGATPSGVADQAVAKLQGQITKKDQELRDAHTKVAQLEKRNQKTVERMHDRLLEEKVRYAAATAKIVDPDYAITLYARSVKASAAAGTDMPTAEVFFAGLKDTHKHLFEGGAPAPAPAPKVAPTTAPPESQQPGAVTPPAAPPGAPPAVKGVDDMNQQDFNQHAKSKYGFTPGT